MAAADIFLELDGIKGESQDSIHKDAMEIMSWSWGASNQGSFHTGTGGGTGKATFHDLTVTKNVDKASSSLWKSVSTGTHIAKGTLYVRKAGGDKPLDYLTIEMTNIIITSLQWGTGHVLVTENLSLNFEIFKITYSQQAATGSGDGTGDFGYNISQHATT